MTATLCRARHRREHGHDGVPEAERALAGKRSISRLVVGKYVRFFSPLRGDLKNYAAIKKTSYPGANSLDLALSSRKDRQNARCLRRSAAQICLVYLSERLCVCEASPGARTYFTLPHKLCCSRFRSLTNDRITTLYTLPRLMLSAYADYVCSNS